MTRIEWVKNPDGTPGYTINPVKGLCPMHCKNLEGYEYCYAAGERGLYKRFKWNPEIRWYPPAWDLVDTLKKPSRVFVGSTFELFHESLPYNWMEYNLLTAKKYPQHTFIFLTKQPQRLSLWNPFPKNCWVGVTMTDRHSANAARQFLLGIEAKVKFLSLEPLLGHMDGWTLGNAIRLADWLIIGQQTPVSAKTQPRIEWVREIVEAADKAGIPVFLKDNLKPLLVSQGGIQQNIFWKDKRDAQGFEELHLELRQEMPG